MSIGAARERGDRITPNGPGLRRGKDSRDIARGRIIEEGRRRGDLPAAGDARREELRARADDLAEVAESLPEAGAIDPAKLKVENEIGTLFDSRHRIKISGLKKSYVYKLVSIRLDGQFIDEARNDGWEVVQGEDPEGIERKGIGGDTTRHYGDCILMRIRKDHFIALERRRREVSARKREAILGDLNELGRRVERRFGKNLVHTDINDPIFQRAVKAGVAKSLADREFDKQLRTGKVPGMEIPE